MNKLLFIVGQTATGKTTTALDLAKKLPAQLISADSRQVYTGMDIGTGKDIPQDFVVEDTTLSSRDRPLRAYSNNSTKIWLVDQVYPNEEWSVAHFTEAAWQIIPTLWEQDILPIIVGGTGFYLQSILTPAATAMIPPQPDLRDELDALSLEQLQAQAEQIAPERYLQLNNSDQNNPRRLVRIIEVAKSTSSKKLQAIQTDIDSLIIGLSADADLLEQRIRARVEERLKQGMVEEVKRIRATYGEKIPAFSATGYAETAAYLDKKISFEELITQWTQRELDYSKRQNTWFKKQLNIRWFNVRDNIEKEHMEKLVKNWYDH